MMPPPISQDGSENNVKYTQSAEAEALYSLSYSSTFLFQIFFIVKYNTNIEKCLIYITSTA